MDLVKTGIGISKTIKNVARFREIITVMGKNGFTDFFAKANLIAKIPNFIISNYADPTPKEILETGSLPKIIGYRLRKSFEELGPSFIKLGQLLSTREDIFPPEFIEQMKILQSHARPVLFADVKVNLEKSLGKKVEDIFSSIDEKAIGTASIGLVYLAKLKTGEDVVIKVRRPGIVKLVETDFDLIKFLVSQAEKVSNEIKSLGILKVIDDFSKSLTFELDFRIEAQNCEKIRRNLEKSGQLELFYIPRVYKEHCREDIIVMEFLKGTPFNQISQHHPDIKIIHEKLLRSVNAFVHSLLVDGFFHADLHGGNFFLLENGKIGIIDFGLMGTLSKRSRENLVAILYSIVTNNFENMVYEFLDVAEYEKVPDVEELIRDIKDCLTPYMGLSVKETNFSAMLKSIVSTHTKHQIFLPREWFIIFRALIALDGVGKSVNIDLNVFESINGEIYEVMDKVLDKDQTINDAMWLGRDALNALRILPRQIRWFLRELSKRNYAFEIKLTGHEKSFNRVSNGLYFLGMSLVASFLLISGTLLIEKSSSLTIHQISHVTWMLWSASGCLFFFAFLFNRKR